MPRPRAVLQPPGAGGVTDLASRLPAAASVLHPPAGRHASVHRTRPSLPAAMRASQKLGGPLPLAVNGSRLEVGHGFCHISPARGRLSFGSCVPSLLQEFGPCTFAHLGGTSLCSLERSRRVLSSLPVHAIGCLLPASICLIPDKRQVVVRTIRPEVYE